MAKYDPAFRTPESDARNLRLDIEAECGLVLPERAVRLIQTTIEDVARRAELRGRREARRLMEAVMGMEPSE